jgi:Leucine-rich repeat (LRR) protein
MLTALNLSNNHLDKFPTEVLGLDQLYALDLKQNNIGSIPYQLGNMQKLSILNLNENPVSSWLTVSTYGTEALKIYITANQYDKLSLEMMDIIFRYVLFTT